MMYAAIYGRPGAESDKQPPTNCIWTRQIQIPLQWLIAFISGQSGNLRRELSLDAYLRRGKSVLLTTDASPYGLGAVLVIDGTIAAWLSCHICNMDRTILGLQMEPSCRDQQALEALAVLVSLREFATYWKKERITLSIRTDNMASLVMLTKMQPHSHQLGIVARELALDISDAVFCPEIVQHIPGISNVAADALSRKGDPHKKVAVPSYLTESTKHVCSIRNKSWWRSLVLPAQP